MNFPLKLDLVLNGYTPTQVGLLTSVLSKRFKISEKQVCDAIGIQTPLKESFLIKGGPDSNLKQAQRWQIDRAVQMLQKMSSLKPDYKEAMATVMAVLQEINFPGTTRAYADRLAKYLMTNWDNLIMAAHPEPTGEEGEEMALRNKLSGVQPIQKARVGSPEPPLEQPASDINAPQSTRFMPAQPQRGAMANRAMAPALGRPAL